MKRPVGITVICIFLGWESIAGITIAFYIFAGEFEPLHFLSGILAVASGIVAGVASVLLWKMQLSALLYLRIWMASIVLFVIVFIVSFGPDFWGGGGLAFAAFFGFAAGIFGFLDYYTRKHVGRAA